MWLPIISSSFIYPIPYLVLRVTAFHASMSSPNNSSSTAIGIDSHGGDISCSDDERLSIGVATLARSAGNNAHHEIVPSSDCNTDTEETATDEVLPTIVLDQQWWDPVANCSALYRGLWYNGQPVSHGVAVYQHSRGPNPLVAVHFEASSGSSSSTPMSLHINPSSSAAVAAASNQQLSLYEGCWKDGQFEGHGRLVYANDDVYTGDFVAGQRHGTGTYQWINGRTYTGAWRHNQRSGRGLYTYPSVSSTSEHMDTSSGQHNRQTSTLGDYYEGEFVLGQRSGRGTFVFGATGASYTGEWKLGSYHGMGRTVDETGCVYEGSFFHGLAHGHGTQYNAQGRKIYAGPWKQGVPLLKNEENLSIATSTEIPGRVAEVATPEDTSSVVLTPATSNQPLQQPDTSASILVYLPSADIRRVVPPPAAAPPPPPTDKLDSSNNPEWPLALDTTDQQQPDVTVVVDQTTTDQLGCTGHYSGMVTASSPLPLSSHNSPSKGQHQPHGVGRMVYSDGSRIHEGFWQFGAKHGHGRCWFVPQQDIHEGEYQKNLRHGPGRYAWRDGRVYVGEYANDERNGHGVFTYPNGERYEG